ncbi:MAG TPA: hypothetical protein VGC07_02485 [Granulicella sp.]
MSRVTTALAALALLLPAAASAQMLLSTNSEVRFQFDLQVPDEALKAALPAGFTSFVATQGPAKDCNLRVVFIDNVTVNGTDNNPVGKGSNRLVYLVAPVKNAAGESVQIVLGGLTDDPADAPGPFSNYLLATTHEMRRTSAAPAASGPVLDTQDWNFTAKTGEHMELHIKYERGNSTLRPYADVKFYSAKNPTDYQISHQTMVLDILKNTTTNPPDKVKEFSLKVSGGSFDKLIGGPLKVLSWDNILWLNRTVSKP